MCSEVEVRDREEDYKKAEERFQEAKRKQEEAEKSAKNILKNLANAIVNAAIAPATMGMVRDIKIFETETDMKITAGYSKEGEQHLLDMQKQRDSRRKALSDIAEFAKSIENCASDSNLATAAIDALHHACNGRLEEAFCSDAEGCSILETNANALRKPCWT